MYTQTPEKGGVLCPRMMYSSLCVVCSIPLFVCVCVHVCVCVFARARESMRACTCMCVLLRPHTYGYKAFCGGEKPLPREQTLSPKVILYKHIVILPTNTPIKPYKTYRS